MQDTTSLIKHHQQLASKSIVSQDFENAIVHLDSANQLAILKKDNLLRGDIKRIVALLHYYLENYNKAASELDKGIKYIQKSTDQTKTSDLNILGKSYTMNGFILTKKGDFVQAEAFFNKADGIFTSLNNEAEQANVIMGRGILELKKGNYKTAINYFDAGIPFFTSDDMRYKTALSYLNKADALTLLEDSTVENKIQEAETSLETANAIIDLDNYPKLKTESYRIASNIAALKNQTTAAYTLLKKYNTRHDSTNRVYMNAISKVAESESNIGDFTATIAAQKDELDKKQKSINVNKLTTGLAIALIVILSLLTLSLYKNNNLRAKANDLLQDKNSELQLAKEKAEKASLAKAQFLSTITHELRTPLYAVTGLTHLLMEENPKAHQKEHLNSLKFSGEYLLSLINNILDLNKLEANKVEIEKRSFNIKKHINDVLIALRKSAEDRKNKLNFEFDEKVPENLMGDPLKLSQILINLVGNSVKFTQNGDIYIRVKKVEQTNNKVMLHFEIQDNGVGISKKKQKSIFETFSQGSLQINRKFGGTGLGLSIVKNLLELMNSKIHLESNLGQGSKFWFNIPFEVSESQIKSNVQNNSSFNIDYTALENKTVLVVEDNKINQMITKKILEKNKMECQVADNGMDAIKLVERNNFDIILMDIHMPGISGIEATQKIRDFNKEIPIIALTAVTIDENLDDFYRAGFNEIIPKPFKTEEFFEKIYHTLDGKKFPVTST
ncbi:response regulator [Cochleicola gelatinilyticus]|nr:response regulator [Cochleicola gelatinilyticus]